MTHSIPTSNTKTISITFKTIKKIHHQMPTMLTNIMLCHVLISMLSVFMINVVMLSVVAPVEEEEEEEIPSNCQKCFRPQTKGAFNFSSSLFRT
jgi:hypothetical protein